MVEIVPIGDWAIRISFGDEISQETHKEIQVFTSKVAAVKLKGVIEWVPAYNTVAIYYRPEIISYNSLVEKIKEIYNQKNTTESIQPIVYKIPVLYNGPDLTRRLAATLESAPLFLSIYHCLRRRCLTLLYSSLQCR